MSLSRVVIWLFVCVGIAVTSDVLWINYSNLRIELQTQTQTVKTAVDQINEIANGTFSKSIAQMYYMQGQLDMYTAQTLGNKAARDFKQREHGYIRKCAPKHGELECRREWYKAHVNRLQEIFDERSHDFQLTPV